MPVNLPMSYPVSSSSGSGGSHQGIRLSNTTHSEVAPCLPLPSLPMLCDASDQDFRLFDEPSRSSARLNYYDVAQASRIADLLRATDVSCLKLREDTAAVQYGYVQPMNLHDEVLQYNPEAFQYTTPVAGLGDDQCSSRTQVRGQ